MKSFQTCTAQGVTTVLLLYCWMLLGMRCMVKHSQSAARCYTKSCCQSAAKVSMLQPPRVLLLGLTKALSYSQELPGIAYNTALGFIVCNGGRVRHTQKSACQNDRGRPLHTALALPSSHPSREPLLTAKAYEPSEEATEAFDSKRHYEG